MSQIRKELLAYAIKTRDYDFYEYIKNGKGTFSTLYRYYLAIK